MIKDLFLSKRIDQRQLKYKNINYFKLLSFRIIYDLITILFFTIIGYLIFLLLGKTLDLLGVDKIDFKLVTIVFDYISKLLNITDFNNTIISIYNVRIIFFIFFNLYYFISKLLRSSLVRGKKGTLSNSMNVQLLSVSIIRIINMLLKVFIEVALLLYLQKIIEGFVNLFVNIDIYSFNNNALNTQILSSYVIFILIYVVLWHALTKPLWYAKLRSKDYEGNYIFSFYGTAMYVGNADDGVTSRLTKYYNNRGASDTGKIYYRRFHLRVFYLYTFGAGKLIEDLLYIILGAPLINTKNTWGHIR